MTADIELLPLPETLVRSGFKSSAEAYAHANVAHATAAKDAEIERLRAERDSFQRVGVAAQARTERLSEALRDGEQIVDEFLQCASIGRPHGKLLAQAKDWLADADEALSQQPAAETQAQGGGEEVAWAVVGNKSGEILNVCHGTREKWLADTKYWPEHGFRTRPLVYGDTAPPSAPVGVDVLLPCPFCGSPAKRIDFGPGDAENEGGSCIACSRCQSSGPVEFGRKENFVANWNRRTAPSVPVGVAVAQVRRGGKGAPHDALYVGLIPRGPATPEVKEGDLLYLAQQPAAPVGEEAKVLARDEHLVLIARALGDALSAHEQLNDEAGWSPLDLAQLRKAAQAVYEMGGEP